MSEVYLFSPFERASHKQAYTPIKLTLRITSRITAGGRQKDTIRERKAETKRPHEDVFPLQDDSVTTRIQTLCA